MTKDEADELVAKCNGLRHQLDQAETLAEFEATLEEYERVSGRPMFFLVEQYDRLLAKAQEEGQ